ncbi:MAG: hypothetical protein R2847_10070 [Bacteroidia bacterium]
MWEPRNSTGTYTYTSKTLRRALAQSVNSITAQLTEMEVGKQVVECAHRLGIKSPLDKQYLPFVLAQVMNVYEMVCA